MTENAPSVKSELESFARELPEGEFKRAFLQYGGAHIERFVFLLGRVRASGLAAGARILDAGSFPGHLSLLLQRRGWRVTALTQPMGGVAMAGDFEDALRRHGVALAECDLEREYAREPAAVFDGAVFTEVLEHMAFNPFHALAEICRLLKPEGCIWVSTPNLGRARNLWRLWRGHSIYQPLGDSWMRVFPTARGGKHEREYTPDELRFLLSPRSRFAYRFEDARVTTHPWFDNDPSGRSRLMRTCEQAMVKVCPRLDNALFASARKPQGLELRTPDQWQAEGDWREMEHPVGVACPQQCAGFAYPFRYLGGEGRLRFRLPADCPRGATGVKISLPFIWPVSEPRLPAQTLIVQAACPGDGAAGTSTTARIAVMPNANMQMVTVPLEGMACSPEREILLKIRSEAPVIPHQVFGNGDVMPVGPGLAWAHWGISV